MSSNQVELKCIFNLFDSNNTGEVDIRMINQLINSLESLNKKKVVAAPSVNTTSKANPESEKSTTNPSTIGKISNMGGSGANGKDSKGGKRVSSDNNLAELEKNMDKEREKEKSEKELKYFPNKKTTINFQDFCNLFNEAMNQKDLQEEMLLNCFYAFDYNQEGVITSKKIKNIFDIFKEKATQEDIENVLKFVGCTKDEMTFGEFKDFFKKNL